MNSVFMSNNPIVTFVQSHELMRAVTSIDTIHSYTSDPVLYMRVFVLTGLPNVDTKSLPTL